MVRHLATLDLMSPELHTPVPLAVLESIDNARNPAAFTRETVERAATENQFLHGKMRAVEVRYVRYISPSRPGVLILTGRA